VYASPNEMVVVDNNLLTHYDILGLKDGKGPTSPGNPPTHPGKPYKVTMKITFYCNCKICTNKSPGDPGYGKTAAQTTACKGTVAGDWKKFPKGTQISFTMEDGSTFTGTVLDKGGGVKGDHLDIWCASHKEAHDLGTMKDVTVTVTPP